MNDTEKAKQRVEAIQEQKRIERERQKPSPNERMAEEGRDFIDSYPFWCDECLADFESSAYKTTHRLFGDTIAVYRAFCGECGEESVRHITHRDHDPYYYKSDRIHRDRGVHEKDMLQHEQYGFKSLYGDVFEEHIKRLKRKEERIIGLEREKGFGGMSWQSQERIKNLRKQ